MKKRSIAAVVILSVVTLGVYCIVWSILTKREMVALGAEIPTAWLIIVPVANIWWTWKYSVGVEKVTNGDNKSAVVFLLLFLLGIIGIAIVQSFFNRLAKEA